MKIAEAFGKVIQKWRLSRNLTQTALAERCDLDRTYISMLERGQKNASIKTIFKICKALKVTPSELLRQTEHDLKSKSRRRALSSTARL